MSDIFRPPPDPSVIQCRECGRVPGKKCSDMSEPPFDYCGGRRSMAGYRQSLLMEMRRVQDTGGVAKKSDPYWDGYVDALQSVVNWMEGR